MLQGPNRPYAQDVRRNHQRVPSNRMDVAQESWIHLLESYNPYASHTTNESLPSGNLTSLGLSSYHTGVSPESLECPFWQTSDSLDCKGCKSLSCLILSAIRSAIPFSMTLSSFTTGAEPWFTSSFRNAIHYCLHVPYDVVHGVLTTELRG